MKVTGKQARSSDMWSFFGQMATQVAAGGGVSAWEMDEQSINPLGRPDGRRRWWVQRGSFTRRLTKRVQ